MRIGRRKRFESEMESEMRFHIDSYVADLIRSGVSRVEAERRARIEFGSIEARKDECREAWGFQRLDELRADLRHTFRMIRRNPGFASVAVLSLALGIGAVTAIFGVLDVVMLRLLPVRDPSRLVFVRMAGTAGHDGPPYPCFELIRDQSQSFEAVAAFSASSMEFVADRGRELVRGVWVSGNFYETLGVAPLIGRRLTADDDRAPGKGGSGGAVAVISRSYWQQRFGGDPAVVGRTIRLFDFPVTIVGVMPAEIMTLEPGMPIDIAVPMVHSSPEKMRDRISLWLDVVARLKPGVSVERARTEVNGIFQAYMSGVSISEEVRKSLYERMVLTPAAKGTSGLRSRFSKPLTALTILAGMVLLAACVNMASLMLARATARQREFAVRLAIGAGRGRLIRQSLTESTVLACSGAALGIVLARQGQTALAAFFSEGNRQIALNLSLDGRVLLFTLAVTLLCGLAVGILPALRATQLDPAAGLQSGSRSVTGNRTSLRLGRALIVVQVALSLVLLAGAGLFIRTLRQLESVDVGFSREGVLTMEISPRRQLFGTPEWLFEQDELLDRVRRIPGVRSAGWATMSPMSGRDRGAVVEVEGFTPQSERDRRIHLAAVSPDYFETIGMPLLGGRGFTARDSSTGHKAAILSESAVRFYFGTANPIGRRVRFTNYQRNDLDYEVVGVVKDVRHDSLREPASRFIYLPIPQSADRINRLALVVRCTGNALTFAAPVRQQVERSRHALLIHNVSTIQKDLEQTLIQERLVAALSATFGTVALVLAGIGLYGILAFAVARRTNEIGIRMALGATKPAIVWLVVAESMALAASGIVIGAPAVFALGRITGALLYGVEPLDPVVLASASSLILAFAALAAVVPGRRASLLDPVSALRRD